MATTTTGSALVSLLDGMNHGVGFSGLASDTLILTRGSPESMVPCQTGSDLAIDVAGGSLWMGLVAGSTGWIALCSGAA